MSEGATSALFLAPRFTSARSGGIEASAALAWQVIEEHFAFRCFQVGPWETGRPRASLLRPSPVWKMAAVLRALTVRPPERLVVWHLGLMQLLPVLRARKSKTILFLHGIEAWRKLGPRSVALLEGVELFLSNSEHTWEGFTRLNPEFQRRKHRTVHLGLGTPAPNLSEPDARPTALMLGRLARTEDYKGHREVIEAWPRVIEALPDATLVIAGDGDLRRDLERAVEQKDLGSSVRFLGWVTEADKADSITRARCLVLPSRAEGFGLVYLEAMRLGRPCLVSTLDAGREVVLPEGGVEVEPSDQEALAVGILRLLRPSDEWDRLALGARKRYESRFTASAFQARLISALSE